MEDRIMQLRKPPQGIPYGAELARTLRTLFGPPSLVRQQLEFPQVLVLGLGGVAVAKMLLGQRRQVISGT